MDSNIKVLRIEGARLKARACFIRLLGDLRVHCQEEAVGNDPR